MRTVVLARLVVVAVIAVVLMSGLVGRSHSGPQIQVSGGAPALSEQSAPVLAQVSR